jgi:hypothetical protein
MDQDKRKIKQLVIKSYSAVATGSFSSVDVPQE